MSDDDTVQDSTPITETGEPVKRGRGRPPGAKNGTHSTPTAQPNAAAQRKAEAAVTTMGTAYELIAMILSPLAPMAAEMFKAGVPAAQQRNRQAFLASPKLADRIASGGSKSGTLGFVIAQGMLVFPVAVAVQVETGLFSAKVKEAPKATARPAGPAKAKAPQTSPDGLFIPDFPTPNTGNPIIPIFPDPLYGDPNLRAEQ